MPSCSVMGDAGPAAHMAGMKQVVAAIVIILVSADLIRTAVRICRNPQHRREYSETVRSLRWWMVPAGMAHLVAVGATAVALLTLVPPLRYGWWSLIGGSGNVLLGQTGNSGTLWRLVGIVLPLILVVVVPWLAHFEESTFRAGSENRSVPRRLAVQLGFGLIHCMVGVPLAVGIALTISGLYYERVYLTAMSRRRSAITEVLETPVLLGYGEDTWNAHTTLSDDSAVRSREIVESWMHDLQSQVKSATAEVEALEQEAVTTAAAAHTVSNWLVLSVLLVSLSGLIT